MVGSGLNVSFRGESTTTSQIIFKDSVLESVTDSWINFTQTLSLSDDVGFIHISLDPNYEFSEEKVDNYLRLPVNKNKIFAIHSSERIRENVDQILDLKPNFLVHMLHATESDFIRLKDNNIPVVICPRSNIFFGLRPNYKLMNKMKKFVDELKRNKEMCGKPMGNLVYTSCPRQQL